MKVNVLFVQEGFDNARPERYPGFMDPLFADPGYPSLFILSLLAATLLPLGSEWLLVLLILRGADPVAAVATAAAGNLLGAFTTWAIGVWGGPLLSRRLLRIPPEKQAQAERLYRRYGIWSLLLSWLPVIGDPLCLVAGLLRTGPVPFAILVLTGKVARYAAVAWLALAGRP